jgi:hypothetical protein
MESELKCPVKATAKASAGKRKVQIVWYLGLQSQRFAKLRNPLPGVSEKVLTGTPAATRECRDSRTYRRNIWGSLRIFPGQPIGNEHVSDLRFKAIS